MESPANKGTTIMATQKIKLVKGVKANFRTGTARAEYFDAICKFNGKPIGDFVKACAANPPSTPRSGKLKGKQEPVQGWVSYFIREGYITLS